MNDRQVDAEEARRQTKAFQARRNEYLLDLAQSGLGHLPGSTLLEIARFAAQCYEEGRDGK